MYDVEANKKSWTDSYSSILNKYDDFIVVEAIEVEDQNTIKIDDYGENILPFSASVRQIYIKSFFWDVFSNDPSRKAIKVPSSGSLIKIFLFCSTRI